MNCAFIAPVAAHAADPGAAVAVAPAVADEVMCHEQLSQDEKDNRKTHNELHSKVLKIHVSNMTLLTLPYVAFIADVLSKVKHFVE